MRILVCPNTLKIGGSAINAIDLAAAVRDRGHEVTVFGEPGPLTERIERRGLPFVPAQAGAVRPSPALAAQLRRTVRRERIDLVHSYEGYLTVESYFGARLGADVPVVASVMAMWVGRLPQSIPVIVGTRTLEEEAGRTRRGPVWRLEPPVDVDEDHPGVATGAFRRAHGLDGDASTVVMVTRLDRDLKLEGAQRAVHAVAALADRSPVRLVLVGGGHGHDDLVRLAEERNAALGKRAIVVTGPLLDPRPAYAAADVVLGMGSSILRGMAFAKPSVVVGLLGFCETVTPATVGRFLRDGFIGIGDGTDPPEALTRRLEDSQFGSADVGAESAGTQRLAQRIEELLADDDERRRLGRFGRELIGERFDLRRAAAVLEGFYEITLEGAAGAGVRRALVPEGLTALAWASAGAVKGRALKVLARS